MTTFSDGSWDGSPSRWPDTPSYCDDCLINLNTGDRKKWIQDKCKLPYREPSGAVNKNALNTISGVLQGSMGGVKGVPADKLKAAARKVLSLMQEAKMLKGPKDRQGLRDLAS